MMGNLCTDEVMITATYLIYVIMYEEAYKFK